MARWLTIDDTGLTLHIPPIPNGLATLLWLTAFGFLVFLLLGALKAWNNRAAIAAFIKPRWRAAISAARRQYVSVLIAFGVVAILWAVAIYLWRIPFLIGDLLRATRSQLDSSATDAEAIRSYAYAFAAFTATLAILLTIPFQLVRVWINERTARTAEENLVTDLINKAVEGLGAEKKTSRIGRVVTLREGAIAEPNSLAKATEIEWQGHALPDATDERITKVGEWQTFETTAPNLEVRLGAIYALERIAQDSDRDHVRVMEILCAYIRQNAPASEAKDHGLGEWPDYPETIIDEERAARDNQMEERRRALRAWTQSLEKPRTDIAAAIEVIGRRSADQIDLEKKRTHRQRAEPYRLDLREVNLQRADMSKLNFNRALFAGAKLEGATIFGAKMEGANLFGAKLQEANLGGAKMGWADLIGAEMEAADLTGAEMEAADLRGTKMERANLRGTKMEKAILGRARMEGADFRGARFQLAMWHGAKLRSLAHSADFRGAYSEDFPDAYRAAYGLTQAQLDNVIGDERTLLPDGPNEHGAPFHVWSCWETPPPDFEVIVRTAAGLFASEDTIATIRAKFLCSPENPRRKTGTPLPLDAPYPPGHPLGGRD